MRKLIINQALLSIKDKYQVYDENNNVVYNIISKLLTFRKTFSIYDVNDKEVAVFKKEFISLMPEFKLYIDNEEVATIRKKISLLKMNIEVLGKGINVKGNILGMDYLIYKNNKEIAHIKKDWNIKDIYEVNVIDEDNEILIISIALAIDYLKSIK